MIISSFLSRVSLPGAQRCDDAINLLIGQFGLCGDYFLDLRIDGR
jgi:hypothetical protein